MIRIPSHQRYAPLWRTRTQLSSRTSTSGLSSRLAGVTVRRCHGIRPKYQSFQNPVRGCEFRLNSISKVSTSPIRTPVASKITSRTKREQNWRRDARLKPVSYRIPKRRVAAETSRRSCWSPSGCLSRATANTPRSERARNLDNRVMRDNGNVLSAMSQSFPRLPTTIPTWFVHEQVALATSRKGLAVTLMNIRSPIRKCRCALARLKLGIAASSVRGMTGRMSPGRLIRTYFLPTCVKCPNRYRISILP
jgi:hypothetical protein